MADFTVRPTAGTTTIDWLDLAGTGRPTRLNPAGQPHRYFKAVLSAAVTLKCTPDGGSEGALDGALGGRLFTSWVGEKPDMSIPTLVSPAGNSSVATFTADLAGHYMVVFRRTGGGAVAIHIDVEVS